MGRNKAGKLVVESRGAPGGVFLRNPKTGHSNYSAKAGNQREEKKRKFFFFVVKLSNGKIHCEKGRDGSTDLSGKTGATAITEGVGGGTH